MTRGRRAAFAAAALVVAACLAALGVWQVERRAWKHELIAAVVQASTVVDGPSWATVRTLARLASAQR